MLFVHVTRQLLGYVNSFFRSCESDVKNVTTVVVVKTKIICQHNIIKFQSFGFVGINDPNAMMIGYGIHRFFHERNDLTTIFQNQRHAQHPFRVFNCEYVFNKFIKI